MSLGRTLFHDLRPLFRVLEEPTRISPSFYYRATNSPRYAFRPWNSKPAFEVVEKEEGYVVEAELPGIKREQLDVKVGDKGRSLTIEGKVSRSDAVKGETESKSSESGRASHLGTSDFVAKVWLPENTDGAAIKAKLEDGFLTVHIPKAKEEPGVQINID